MTRFIRHFDTALYEGLFSLPGSRIMLGCRASIQVGGRIKRVREFELVEGKLQPLLKRMRQEGIERGEVLPGSPIFPGMPDDAGFFTTETAFSGNICPV